MSISNIHRSDKPFDRLTELANRMQLLTQTDEYADVKGIIFLSDPDGGGIVMFGYPDSEAGLSELLIHMKVVFSELGGQIAEQPRGSDEEE